MDAAKDSNESDAAQVDMRWSPLGACDKTFLLFSRDYLKHHRRPSQQEERQKDYTENRKVKGLKIGPLDGVDLYWYSYPPAYAKTILDNWEYSCDHRPSMQMGPGSVVPALAFFLRPTQPTLAILSHRAGQQQGHPWPQG
jgi:hypothetical protein